MESFKLHPRVVQDDSGLKFLFNHDNSHFTMRFSGRPMFLLEEWYYHLGWQNPNFIDLYNDVKSGKTVSQEDIAIMKLVIEKSTEFFTILERISKRNVSPFTIYVQPFDHTKAPRHTFI